MKMESLRVFNVTCPQGPAGVPIPKAMPSTILMNSLKILQECTTKNAQQNLQVHVIDFRRKLIAKDMSKVNTGHNVKKMVFFTQSNAFSRLDLAGVLKKMVKELRMKFSLTV